MRSILLLLLLGIGVSYGQKAPDLSRFKTKEARLQRWSDYCDQLVAAENYAELRKAGKQGLNMTAKNDNYNQSLFLFYVGVTFNFGLETDSAAYYLERSEHYGRRAKNNKRVLEAMYQLHYVYTSYGSAKKRMRIINEFQTVLDTVKDPKAKADIYSVISDYYVNTGQYERGLDYKLKGIKVRRTFLKKGAAIDSTNLGVQLIMVGELYIGMDKHRLALNYLKESEQYISNYNEATAHIYKDLIECYTHQGQLHKALAEYRKLVRLLNNESSLACWGMLLESDLVLANYYRDKGNFSEAMKSVNHARELAPAYGDQFQKAQVDVVTGTIYLEQKEFQKALNYLKAAEPTTSEDDPELIAQLQLALSKTYAGLGKWEEAYRYQKAYATLQDRLLSEKSKKNLAEMEARFQNERKQSEINRLEAKNATGDLKIAEARKSQLYFAIAIVIALAIGGLFFVQSRNRKKHNAQLHILNNELTEANAIKARFFSIINHDLRSPVANLIHFLQLQRESPDLMDEATRVRLHERTLAGAENLLHSMEDMLLWSKGQMQQFKPVIEPLQVQAVFNDLKAYFVSEERVIVTVESEENLTLLTDINFLQTILRNLTANAIRALEKSDQPHISWSARTEGNTTVLHITDNGPGASQHDFKALYDETEVVGIKTGLGLHLIRDLAKAIHCEIAVTTQPGNGTTITLTFG